LTGEVDAEAADTAAAAVAAAETASRFVFQSRSRVVALLSSFSDLSVFSGLSRRSRSPLSGRSPRSLSDRSRSRSLSRSLAPDGAGASPRPVRGDEAAIARGADGGITDVFNEGAMDAEDEACGRDDVWSVRGERFNCLSEVVPLPSFSAPSRSFFLRSDSRTDSRPLSLSPGRLLLSSR